MSDLLRFALLGLGSGGLYAISAVGLVLVYRGSGVVNFSQAAMGMVGAYVHYEVFVRHGLPFALGLIAGMAASAFAGASFHLVVMARMQTASDLAKIIATLAYLVILTTGAFLIYGPDPRLIPSTLPVSRVVIFGSSIGADKVWIFGIVLVLTFVLWLVYRLTLFGVATSAVAENPRASAALGVSPNRIAALNWAVGGALSAIASILLVPITGLNGGILAFIIIPLLAAAVLGGFSSFPITTAAGLAIGIAQSWVTRYVSAPGWGSAIPFLFVGVVLVLRGRTVAGKDERFGRMPRLGLGRLSSGLVIFGVVVVEFVTWFWFSPKWLDSVIVQLLAVLILMSFVAVTGFAGQLSLAQMGFAGVAALVAAYLFARQGWPMPAALGVGVLATIPIGVILGLAGTRTRGVNLAILTFGFAISLQSVLFANSKFNGGTAGYRVDDPTFFGIHVSSIDHPERYATLVLVVVLLVGLGLLNLRRSRVGRRLIAVRTNERAAAALGVSVVGAKLYAFVLGGMIAGIGGVLIAFRLPQVTFRDFDGFNSIVTMQNAVLGGVGTLGGPLVGSGFQPGSVGQQIFSFLGGRAVLYLALASGFLLLLMLTRNPDGLAFLVRRQNAWWLDRLRQRFPSRRAALDVMGTDPADAPRVRPTTLDVRGVTVRFGGTVALNNFSVTVGPGEVVGLIGPNGAGKSTAIDAITGFVTPAEGTVSLDSEPIEGWTRERRARAGLSRSFQTLELFDDLTVLENIQAADDGRDLLGYVTALFRPGRARLGGPARAAILEFGLERDLDRYVHELSYAQRRMLAVARAVAGGQPVLLLDEPASGLDDQQTRRLSETIRRLAVERGVAVLLIEHNVDMVLRTCDRVYALNFGEIIGDGTPAEIRANPAVIEAYLGTPREAIHATADT